MSLLLQLLAQFLRCVALLCKKGGLKAVVAQNLLLTQQLIILNHGRQLGPSVSPLQRIWLAFYSMFCLPGASNKRPLLSGLQLSFDSKNSWSAINIDSCFQAGSTRSLVQNVPALKSSLLSLISKNAIHIAVTRELLSNFQSISKSISNPMLSGEFSSSTSKEDLGQTGPPGSLSSDIAKILFAAWTSLRPN